jgi:hypothetical protein
MTISSASQKEWFTNHITMLMTAIAAESAEADAEGDFPIHGETAQAWVRPHTQEPWGVHVFALAAHSIPLKAAVLKELNEINGSDALVRVAWHSGAVIADYHLFADAVTEDNLREAIGRVITVADRIGPLLAAVHGGITPIAVEPSSSDA